MAAHIVGFMMKCHVKYLGCAAAFVVGGLGVAPPAQAETRHVVRAGQSIQKAVDAAKPGDTIEIRPGTYRESIEITTSGITLRGSGSKTVIKPAASTTRAENACGKAGNGLCVTGTASHRVDGVTIRSLTLSGFKKNALWATRTDRLSVRDVTAQSNGQWGIAQERSTRGVFVDNTAKNNGESGIFVANTVDREGGATDQHGTLIAGNHLTGNRIGVTVRRVRNLTVDDNRISGNCGGVFVVGDEGTPKAGDMTIRRNVVYDNNKYCPGNSRLPYIQGSGIILTGAEDTRVTQNLVWGHQGASPLSGGIVLFPSFVGATNSDNVVSNNVALYNKPSDVANRDKGTGNRFSGNMCRVSEPSGSGGPC